MEYFSKPGPYNDLGTDEVVVIDTETTGLSAFGDHPDRMCSISLINLRKIKGLWQETGQIGFTLDPEREIPEIASKVNGFYWDPSEYKSFEKTGSNLFGFPKFYEVSNVILDFIGRKPLVFHNAVFDFGFVDAELMRIGKDPLENLYICTKKSFAEAKGLGRPNEYTPKTSLDNLCDELGIVRTERDQKGHTAMIDTSLTAKCFSKLEPMKWILSEDPSLLPHRENISTLTFKR